MFVSSKPCLWLSKYIIHDGFSKQWKSTRFDDDDDDGQYRLGRGQVRVHSIILDRFWVLICMCTHNILYAIALCMRHRLPAVNPLSKCLGALVYENYTRHFFPSPTHCWILRFLLYIYMINGRNRTHVAEQCLETNGHAATNEKAQYVVTSTRMNRKCDVLTPKRKSR